jgi:hypothetical protein
MFESRTMPPSLFGFAVAAFLLVAVILGARETQDPSNTALIGSAPISAPGTI